jgi:hypothetical protein
MNHAVISILILYVLSVGNIAYSIYKFRRDETELDAHLAKQQKQAEANYYLSLN